MIDNGSVGAAGSPAVAWTFIQVCYECDPPRTVNYLNGERVPARAARVGDRLRGLTVTTPT
jgi:hypothetical protein